MSIHPTAIVDPSAEIGSGVIIGAYAFIGPGVKLGDGCEIHHHGVVEGRTVLGIGNEIFPFACIGTKTHDLKYKGGNPGLRIGDHNTFREYVTVHGATKAEEDTIVGNNNTILAYSHIAHDCIVGDHLVMSSHSALGGHVVVGNHVTMGWSSGVHQFARVGDHAMIAACSKVVQDVLPFMIIDGNPAEHKAVNRIGLERAGFTDDQLKEIRHLFKIIFRSGLNRSQAVETMKAHAKQGTPTHKLIQAIENSVRGVS